MVYIYTAGAPAVPIVETSRAASHCRLRGRCDCVKLWGINRGVAGIELIWILDLIGLGGMTVTPF